MSVQVSVWRGINFFLINVQQIPRNGYGGETKKIIKIIIKEPLQNFRFVGQIIIIIFFKLGVIMSIRRWFGCLGRNYYYYYFFLGRGEGVHFLSIFYKVTMSVYIQNFRSVGSKIRIF